METIDFLHPTKGRMRKRGTIESIGGISFCIIEDGKKWNAGLPGAYTDFIMCKQADSREALINTLEISNPATWADDFDKATYKNMVANKLTLHEEYVDGLIASAEAYQYLLKP